MSEATEMFFLLKDAEDNMHETCDQRGNFMEMGSENRFYVVSGGHVMKNKVLTVFDTNSPY